MNVTDLIERLRYGVEHYDDRDDAVMTQAADALKAQAREIERLTKLLSGRARWHEIEVLESRLASVERERNEAVALLREARMGVKNSAVQFGYPYTEYVDNIDAFLAKANQPPFPRAVKCDRCGLWIAPLAAHNCPSVNQLDESK